MNLLCCIPYKPHGNLGAAYNDFMSRLANDEWAVFIDHDAAFTTPDWHKQLLQAIAAHPNAGLFTAKTNRIGNPMQRDTTVQGHDMRAHRAHGKTLAGRTSVTDVTGLPQLISGVVMCLSKRTWERVGGFCDGFLGVDNDMHRKCMQAGLRVYILNGLYVYHWYRETL